MTQKNVHTTQLSLAPPPYVRNRYKKPNPRWLPHLSAVERDPRLHASHAELLGVVAGEEEQRLELDGGVRAEVELFRRGAGERRELR